ACDRGCGAQAGGGAASPVGEWGSIRSAVQPEGSSESAGQGEGGCVRFEDKGTDQGKVFGIGKNGNLRDMQKRRGRVTAGGGAGRLVPAMETTQTVSEIAAPLVSRTPKCTTSADGSVAILSVARESDRAEDQQRENPEPYRQTRNGRRAQARMRRCLKLCQGA